MINLDNFKDMILIKDCQIDDGEIVFIEEQYGDTEEKENDNNGWNDLSSLNRNTSISSMRTISFVPVKKKFNLTDNLKNYSTSKFEKLILDRIIEQSLKHDNSIDYSDKHKVFEYKTLLNDNKDKLLTERFNLIERKFIAKLHSISNYIAVNSRMGPANTIIMHYDLYKELKRNHKNIYDVIPSYNIILSSNINSKQILIFRLESDVSKPNLLLIYNTINNNFSIEAPNRNTHKTYALLDIDIELQKEIRYKKMKNIINK